MNIATEIKNLIADQLGVAVKDLQDSTKFSDINADSLDIVELVMQVEDCIEAEIDETSDPFDKGEDMTIGEFIAGVEKIKGAA